MTIDAALTKSEARLNQVLDYLNLNSPATEPTVESAIFIALVTVEEQLKTVLPAAKEAEIKRLYPEDQMDYFRTVLKDRSAEPPSLAACYSMMRRWQQLETLIHAKLDSEFTIWSAPDPFLSWSDDDG